MKNPRPNSQTTRPLILVVEDDNVSKAIVDGMLAESDYKVCFATSSAEFLTKLSTMPIKPELLILDSWIDNKFCAELIRQIPPGLSIPILIASGDDCILDRIRSTGLVIPPEFVLIKPFSKTQLVATLNRAFGRDPLSCGENT